MNPGRGIGLAVGCLLAACSSGVAWTAVAVDSPSQAAQREAAAAARDQLASRLLAELTTALQGGGPGQAIPVCRQRAPALAQQIGDEHHLRIGRTSVRLRNPANRAPAWAAAHVAAARPEPAFFVGPERQLGALYPIRLQPQCVQCHGAAEQLAPAVRVALQQHYPHDTATGFAAGDLRGWFWVEVP